MGGNAFREVSKINKKEYFIISSDFISKLSKKLNIKTEEIELIGSINKKNKKEYGDIDLMISIEQLKKYFDFEEEYPYNNLINNLINHIKEIYPTIEIRNIIDYGAISLKYEYKDKLIQIDILTPLTIELGHYIYDTNKTNYKETDYTNLYRNELLKELVKEISSNEYIFKEAYGIVKPTMGIVKENINDRLKIKRKKMISIININKNIDDIKKYIFKEKVDIENTRTVEQIISLMKNNKTNCSCSYEYILENVNKELKIRNYKEIKF